jgi:hypothetical protein
MIARISLDRLILYIALSYVEHLALANQEIHDIECIPSKIPATPVQLEADRFFLAANSTVLDGANKVHVLCYLCGVLYHHEVFEPLKLDSPDSYSEDRYP